MVAYSFKRPFIRPIQAGLGILPVVDRHPAEFVIEDGGKVRAFDSERDLDPPVRPKRQTIRAGIFRRNGDAWSKAKRGRRHARPGEELQLYFGMRTKSVKLIGNARCIETKPVLLEFVAGICIATVDGELYGPRKMRAFAQADGFESPAGMAAFWRKENGTRDGDRWSGVLIRWEPL